VAAGLVLTVPTIGTISHVNELLLTLSGEPYALWIELASVTIGFIPLGAVCAIIWGVATFQPWKRTLSIFVLATLAFSGAAALIFSRWWLLPVADRFVELSI